MDCDRVVDKHTAMIRLFHRRLLCRFLLFLLNSLEEVRIGIAAFPFSSCDRDLFVSFFGIDLIDSQRPWIRIVIEF